MKVFYHHLPLLQLSIILVQIHTTFESSSVECCLSEHLLVALEMLKEGIGSILLSKTSHNGLIILKSGDLFGFMIMTPYFIHFSTGVRNLKF